MKLKKILSLILASVMLVTLLAACGGGGNTVKPMSAPDGLPIKTNTPRDTFVVGDAGELNGDFVDGFGENAYDLDIKYLLHGKTNTYELNDADQIILNEMVVDELDIQTDAAGNKTFTFTIHKDLKFSDGSSIKAKDYVGAALMSASNEWLEVGASSTFGPGLLGHAEFNAGETDTFSAVKLLGEYKFSLTIDAEELPYFFEAAYVLIGPIPMHVYFPNVDIESSDAGARFTADIAADCQRISETERYAPTVVPGPYMFVSFENQICTLKRNPHFKGDPVSGNKPYFEYVIRQTVPEETAIDILMAGDIDLLSQEIEGKVIDQAKADEYINTSSYLRNGYGAMNMVCDWGVTADVNVRWAIAHLIDRNTLVDHFCGGYGGVIDAEYGYAQWTYLAKRAEIDAGVIPISMNIAKANEYLDKTDWLYEADGSTPFDSSKAAADGSYMRHNSAGEMLTVRQAAGNEAIGTLCDLEFQKNAPLAGMNYLVDNVDFNILLQQYYYAADLEDHERIYNTFSMGGGFGQPDDKYWGSYHSDHYGTWVNANGINDPHMDDLINRMRRLEPTQTAEYADLWLEFTLYAQSLMPLLPLYSNEYYELFNNVVVDVPTTPFAAWSQKICDIQKYK
jgi:peptide/nickel transport system substrate-binding protein